MTPLQKILSEYRSTSQRQSVTTDKASNITNDAHLWATETMHNPAYPMELFLRVAKVSVETVRIVKGLPELEIN